MAGMAAQLHPDNGEQQELSFIDAGVTSLRTLGLSTGAYAGIISLVLHCNYINKIEGLDALPSLRRLDLSSNRISRIEGLDSLFNLRSLNLASNKITNIDGVGALGRLETLNLSYNSIETLSGIALLSGPDHSLRTLDVRGNRITSLGEFAHLSHCPYLSFLSVSTGASASGVARSDPSNPVCADPNYRPIAFGHIASLASLDGVDRYGRAVQGDVADMEDALASYMELLGPSDAHSSENDERGDGMYRERRNGRRPSSATGVAVAATAPVRGDRRAADADTDADRRRNVRIQGAHSSEARDEGVQTSVTAERWSRAYDNGDASITSPDASNASARHVSVGNQTTSQTDEAVQTDASPPATAQSRDMRGSDEPLSSSASAAASQHPSTAHAQPQPHSHSRIDDALDKFHNRSRNPYDYGVEEPLDDSPQKALPSTSGASAVEPRGVKKTAARGRSAPTAKSPAKSSTTNATRVGMGGVRRDGTTTVEASVAARAEVAKDVAERERLKRDAAGVFSDVRPSLLPVPSHVSTAAAAAAGGAGVRKSGGVFVKREYPIPSSRVNSGVSDGGRRQVRARDLPSAPEDDLEARVTDSLDVMVGSVSRERQAEADTLSVESEAEDERAYAKSVHRAMHRRKCPRDAVLEARIQELTVLVKRHESQLSDAQTARATAESEAKELRIREQAALGALDICRTDAIIVRERAAGEIDALKRLLEERKSVADGAVAEIDTLRGELSAALSNASDHSRLLERQLAATKTELDICRDTVKFGRKEVQKLQGLLASREAEHKEDVARRLDMRSSDVEAMVRRERDNEKQRWETIVAQWQTKHAELEAEFREALVVEADRRAQLQQALSDAEDAVSDIAQREQESREGEKRAVEVVRDMTEMVKQQKARIQELVASREDAIAVAREEVARAQNEIDDLKRWKDECAAAKRAEAEFRSKYAASESHLRRLQQERDLWSKELATQGASLSRDRGMLEAKVASLTDELGRCKHECAKWKEAATVKAKIVDDQSDTIRKLKADAADMKAVHADRVYELEQRLDEEVASSKALQEALEASESSLVDIKKASDARDADVERLQSSVESKERALQAVEHEVVELRGLFVAKEKRVVDDANKQVALISEELRRVKGELAGLQKTVLNATGERDEAIAAAHRFKRDLSDARKQVRQTEDEMRQLLLEVERRERSADERIGKFTTAISEMQRNLLAQ